MAVPIPVPAVVELTTADAVVIILFTGGGKGAGSDRSGHVVATVVAAEIASIPTGTRAVTVAFMASTPRAAYIVARARGRIVGGPYADARTQVRSVLTARHALRGQSQQQPDTDGGTYRRVNEATMTVHETGQRLHR